MLPCLVEIPGAPYAVLPPGVHWATLEDVAARFATSPRRVWLYEGLVQIAANLAAAGCRRLYVDGSFVTAEEEPEDYDGCWDPVGVVADRLHPVLLDLSNGRAAQKRLFRGEVFPAELTSGEHGTFLEFFQIERHTGAAKGVVALVLNEDAGASR